MTVAADRGSNEFSHVYVAAYPGGQRVPLYVIDDRNRLIESSRFADRFAACLENGDYEEAVIAFVFQAVNNGVPGTPALSINGGEPFFLTESGYDGLKELLDAELGS